MGDAVGQVLSFGVGVALSPIPIIGVVLMLGTPQARANGLAFIAGWIFGLAVVGAIVLLAASGAGASDSGAPADWVGIVKLALGVLLGIVAVRQWHARPRAGTEPKLPAWMKAIDTFTPLKAAAMAVVLSAVNPKNLLLVVGAAAAIAQTGASTVDQAVALAVFVLLGTIGPAIPVAIYFLLRERAAAVLEGMRGWMARENATIMAVLCLVIGAKLIGDAISGLAA
ncbi:MAG TPA: GAP family protein [Solirubrobacteraceae bacterium]